MGFGFAPASAAVVACAPGPVANLAEGCIASGNDHLSSVESALAAALGVDVNSLTLSLYGKSDNNYSLFWFSEAQIDDDDADSIANDGFAVNTLDWSVLDGTLIKYVTVKAGNDFKLYEIPNGGASSGEDFSSIGIKVGKKGNTPDISHISFWTVPNVAPPIPEPATWAMMMAGLGFAGMVMRRRATKVQFA
ncbi:MAG: PEPxxWA-CTERM sorting domain-containing protein [Alphaproteobacteria bacterium]|nr:PEPxxWA-CTERM sorting domain-containing protein [Alphaproteobacteria bacterium]MBU0793801.1 PEPxxWA-CTERM sorting domain-containing protein [Alphaproteobacteria bacterium]MBU0875196.1 PEPxxWA-CTERM sorting domain-containing protein [Alphaproteobacteria bacterium]MBU1768945.1 PEPxxWA-CTERM sorting domain-containing protein [Alphaproteobacteria bacterium]